MEAQNASHSAAWFDAKLAQRFWQRIMRELLVFLLLLLGSGYLADYARYQPVGQRQRFFVGSVFDW